jgi:hypothetical protein
MKSFSHLPFMLRLLTLWYFHMVLKALIRLYLGDNIIAIINSFQIQTKIYQFTGEKNQCFEGLVHFFNSIQYLYLIIIHCQQQLQQYSAVLEQNSCLKTVLNKFIVIYFIQTSLI